MKTVTIHFTGGSPCILTVPAEAVAGLFKSLATESDGKTTINNDDGPVTLLNRAQITFVEVG